LNKYGFRIRTRGGMVVDNLMVQARSREEAERRLSQIYHHCEILECRELAPTTRGENIDLEDVLSLISRQQD